MIDYVNKYFEKSIYSTDKNFVNFVKLNTDEELTDATEDDLKDENIDFLAKRIAWNMFYFTQNINTAKTDYITLIGILIKKGIIFKEFKYLKTDTNYFNEK